MRHLTLATALMLLAAPLQAEGVSLRSTDMSFDDVAFGVENAILGEGLVIDHVNEVGEMLARTREDVGSDVVIYEKAKTYSLCSATTSRAVMEADATLLAFCPYGIFIMVRADTPEVTEIGRIDYPDGPMDEVEALLDRIIEAALDGF